MRATSGVLTFVASLLVVGFMLTASAGSADAAGVPKGKGLGSFTVNCPDLGGDVVFIGPEPGNAVWLTDGTMLMLKTIGATFTETDSDGNVLGTGSFFLSFGKKVGLGASTHCTAHFEDTHDGITFTADFDADLVVVPRR